MKLKEIKIVLKKINHIIPYDYYQRMHGAVCRITGVNETYGSKCNRYIYTNLIGGENTTKGIVFKNNPYFIIRFSSIDTELFSNIVNNITSDKRLFLGLEIDGVFSPTDTNVDRCLFRTMKQSPILISKKYDKSYINNCEIVEDVEKSLIENIKNKALECGFVVDKDLKIKIKSIHNNKTINYNGIFNVGRVFELLIYANEDTKNFILLNGLGRSCGCGFGFIY